MPNSSIADLIANELLEGIKSVDAVIAHLNDLVCTSLRMEMANV